MLLRAFCNWQMLVDLKADLKIVNAGRFIDNSNLVSRRIYIINSFRFTSQMYMQASALWRVDIVCITLLTTSQEFFNFIEALCIIVLFDKLLFEFLSIQKTQKNDFLIIICIVGEIQLYQTLRRLAHNVKHYTFLLQQQQQEQPNDIEH